MIQKILIAVEQASQGKMLLDRLSEKGMLADVAADRDAMWGHFQQQTSDLLIVSSSFLSFPKKGQIAQINTFPESPAIILLSNNEGPEERAEFLAAGCQAVLNENLSVEQIGNVVDSILNSREEVFKKTIEVQRLLDDPRLSDFVSQSPAMQTFMQMVYRVVKSDATLLLLGETGVGKERLARAIHLDSTRKQGPFVAINCGALPESLLESELFGHEKGAFTGATRQRRGTFEVADRGTVFLDEIGELPHHLQVKLLRVLQEREIQRVGGERTIKVDVRIMAATNRDIELQVDSGQFRRDLFYRLNVVALEIPPLRERIEDIQTLVQSYINHFRTKMPCSVVSIQPEVLEALKAYGWPGNIRELVNVIERGLLLCTGTQISLDDLPADIIQKIPFVEERNVLVNALQGNAGFPDEWLKKPIRDFRKIVLDTSEREYLQNLLSKTGGRISETARLAGIQPRALFERMRHYRLKKEDYRNRPVELEKRPKSDLRGRFEEHRP